MISKFIWRRLTFLYCFLREWRATDRNNAGVVHLCNAILYAKQFYQTIQVIRLKRILQRLALSGCGCVCVCVWHTRNAHSQVCDMHFKTVHYHCIDNGKTHPLSNVFDKCTTNCDAIGIINSTKRCELHKTEIKPLHNEAWEKLDQVSILFFYFHSFPCPSTIDKMRRYWTLHSSAIEMKFAIF